MVGRLKRDRSGATLLCIRRSLESLRNNVEIVTSSFSVFDCLSWSGRRIGTASIGTRASPGTLTSSEDTVNHVDPIEERVDDEHDGIEHDLIATQFGTEVKHKKPVETKRDGDEANGQVLDLLGCCNERDDHDEEKESGGSDGVLHEAYDAEDGIAFPESNIRQHAHFVGDETKEPAATLLEK